MDRMMDRAGEGAGSQEEVRWPFSICARTTPPVDAIGTLQHGQTT
jgi:hypothetical protein